MATSHVSGTAALALTQPVQASYDTNFNGFWDPSELFEWLRDTADDLGVIGDDPFYGSGLVDAREAVTGLQ